MDKQAKKILFQTYWGSKGWKNKEDRITANKDFLYAKEKGLMFEPLSISHDECVARIFALSKEIQQGKVIQAFLSSLSSRRLDWRSSIASWYLAEKIIPHYYTPKVSGHFYENGEISQTIYTCKICSDWNETLGGYEYYENEDINVLNFERIKWGGVRHGNLIYTLFDLEQFQRAVITQPTKKDIKIFKEILSVVENAQPNDYPSSLLKPVSEIEDFKSNKSERQVLLELLACIGVLKPASYNRSLRGKSDWHFVEYWRGEDKYDTEAVKNLFGKFLDI